MKKFFENAALWVANAVGTPWAFLAAFGFVLGWALSGPLFGFSEKWQLVINTGTTIVTFLMVFIIQNAQNRGDKAAQLKLDEILRAIDNARSGFVDIEELSEDDLNKLKKEMNRVGDGHANQIEDAKADVDGDEA